MKRIGPEYTYLMINTTIKSNSSRLIRCDICRGIIDLDKDIVWKDGISYCPMHNPFIEESPYKLKDDYNNLVYNRNNKITYK